MLASWTIRLFAPSPLPIPPAALQERTDTAGLVWRGLFSGRNVGPIVLRGVVVAGPSDSAAVLSVNGAPGRAYRIGQEVASGVRLVEVGARSATLDRNGVRETLPLPTRGSSAKIGPSPAR